MNKKALLKLAAHIEKQSIGDYHAGEGFSMYHYFHSCGTPSCVAGYAVALLKPGSLCDVLEHIGGNYHTRVQKTIDTASMALGLSKVQASMLFEVGQSHIVPMEEQARHRFLDWGYITPDVAAQCIRTFVKTGEIDWLQAIVDAGKPLKESLHKYLKEPK